MYIFCAGIHKMIYFARGTTAATREAQILAPHPFGQRALVQCGRVEARAQSALTANKWALVEMNAAISGEAASRRSHCER